ncbi:MAG TPA: hypothetical protein PKA37_04435 [Planctomycetota bacterium]|nr:hypothetical protein [Planctomycetota bacterium]
MHGKHDLLIASLTGLGEALAFEFADGRLWYEADVQRATAAFLDKTLRSSDSRWQFGIEHRLYDQRPDVACYYRPTDYREFLANPEAHVVGVVEIKWCAEPRPDLAKLASMQEGRGLVAWMVYGDHFCASIHRTYARIQEERADKITEWVGQGARRGQTVLRCGDIRRGSGMDGSALDAINLTDLFWIVDVGRAAQLDAGSDDRSGRTSPP